MSDKHDEPTPETRIMLYRGPNTRDEIEKRREQIIQIREDLYRQGKVPDNFMVVKELEKYGYYITDRTIRRDMAEINRENSYVLDLAKWNYNGLVEYMFATLEAIVRDCSDIIATKWTNSKVVVTEEEGENGMKVKKQKIITDELAGPRLQANKTKLDVIKIYVEIFKGGVIDTSIAILSQNVERMRREYDEAMNKIKDQSEIIEKLKNNAIVEPTN